MRAMNPRASALARAEQFGGLSRGPGQEVGSRRAIHSPTCDRERGSACMPGVYDGRRARFRPSGRAMAATLWAGAGARGVARDGGVAVGASRERERDVEMWVPAAAAARDTMASSSTGGRASIRADRTTLGPIPITTPVRTLDRPAGRHRRSTARRRDGERDQAAARYDPERLAARLDALAGSGRPGAGRLARARSTAAAMVRRWSRRSRPRVARCIVESGVRLPVRQHWVDVPEGVIGSTSPGPTSSSGSSATATSTTATGARSARTASGSRSSPRRAGALMAVTWDVARAQPDACSAGSRWRSPPDSCGTSTGSALGPRRVCRTPRGVSPSGLCGRSCRRRGRRSRRGWGR